MAGRGGAESDAGVEKGGGDGGGGAVRGDGRQRFLRDEGPRAVRRSKNIQINSARLVPMMAANVVQHKTRPRRSRPCTDGRTYSRTVCTCARAHA